MDLPEPFKFTWGAGRNTLAALAEQGRQVPGVGGAGAAAASKFRRGAAADALHLSAS
jgi:hypothetical protein